jgi:serine/threonine protein kinase/tetratricopeptide (TPR) repeat protein
MGDDRSEQVKKFFEAALLLPVEKREDILGAIDPSLRKEVESLIASHQEPARSLDQTPPIDSMTITRHKDVEVDDRQIGPYRILSEIGQGGMGVVYEAEQEKPVHRRVALKLIKWGMDTKAVIARFESERQALALMNHPNIASVYDAGATNEGRPYFAMELVHGEPITEYCDKNRLTIKERLGLFIQVCEGVQHAHQKGIIHRDIKPSNILITIQDDKPVPKIIDFGVAKATSQRLTERTVYTELGQLIGTPEYMSPEQAEMTGIDIDTRTDVYSLGVVLYELLVGAQPFDAKELRQASFDDMRRKIREEEPSKPSTRLSHLGEPSTTAAKNRRAELRSLERDLQGDLDWITMKALEKDRTRRYGSPSDLSADIERHIRHEPVLASPPSTVYRATKFIRRHTVGVAAVAAIALLLVALLVGMTVQAARIALERDRANREAEAANQVSDFLVNLFEVSDPGEARGNRVTAREILDRGAEKVSQELEAQPLVQAQLMDTIGQVYGKLGLYGQAEPLTRTALDIRRDVLGDEHVDVAESLVHLGGLLRLRGDYGEAKPLFEMSLDILEEVHGPDHPDVAAPLHNLGNLLMYQGNYDEATPVLERALEIREKTHGSAHADVASTLNSLGALHYFMGERDRAGSYFERVLAVRETLLGQDHPDLASTLNNLGLVKRETGDYDEAEVLLKRAISIQERVLGPEHADLAAALNNLGYVNQSKGDLAAAKSCYERAIRIQEKAHGPDHPELARFLQQLSGVLLEEGNYAKAWTLMEQALDIRERVLGPDHPDTSHSLEGLARLHLYEGRYEKAEALFRRAVTIVEKAIGPNSVDMAGSLDGLGEVCSRQGRLAEAEDYFKRSLAIREEALEPDHPLVAETLKSYAALLHEMDRSQEARALEARAERIQIKRNQSKK